ncbi:MAG: polysulfide reductase NrfD [bacterium]|nr:polysulfide reductase NrfD [bacterium]
MQEVVQRETGGLIEGKHNYESVTQKIASVAMGYKHPLPWYVVTALASAGVFMLIVTISWLLLRGVGIWGINQPNGWGFDIINFVWWIGIGHAGTLISAILLLLRQQWRTSINRFAEAMTIFAVMCAGIYPLLHTGRPWVAYWLLPIPNWTGAWPQFRSPLIWDVFAVTTYFTVSLLFWFTGLIPDFATLRDRAKKRISQIIYGILAMGWRGSAKHWHRYESAYLLLAGLSTPLVVSVHSIVSLDFAVSLIPGWHTTVFPPYFVAGAIYSGFAMVLTLVIPIRAWYKMQDFITMKHIDWMAKIMLATGLIVVYGYIMEIFTSLYSGHTAEVYLVSNRFFGPYAPLFWALLICNGLIPQVLWSAKMRQNLPLLFVISLIVNVGMWLERFVIIVTSLHRDFLPSSWGMYFPTIWDWTMFIGTISFFTFMMFLFVRYIPMIAIFEMRDLLHQTDKHRHAPAGAPAAHVATTEVSS